jgi:NAD-dependent dihydropyrimidine dehydrogenase PreA subunit
VVAAQARPARSSTHLTLAEVRQIALDAGADDAGAAPLTHPALAEERPHVLKAMPDARTVVAIVLRMHPDNIRSPQRSVANLEFHRTGHEVDEVARKVALALAERGHRAINPAMAFPMEMQEFPGRSFIVSHKRVAVAAELGRMGLHRNVIHPRFGSFILLGTVITAAAIEGEPAPLAFDPCVTCKLCVAACPVGAIEPDGAFRFSACYDHNYRDFMTGFTDFVEEVVESRDRHDFRERVPLNEAMSTWQSLAYKPTYKAAYCLSVCPAGEDVIGPFVAGREAYLRDVVRPLTEKVETVYVVRGSDAEAHVRKRFPHKRVRVIRSSLRATDVRAFFRAMPLTFQRRPARGMRATFHFDLTGHAAAQKTVRIDEGRLEVSDGFVGEADVRVETDAQLWLDIVNKRRSPVVAVLTRKMTVRGDRKLLARFAACFPR